MSANLNLGRVPHGETFNNGATEEYLRDREIDELRSSIRISALTQQQRNVLNQDLERDLLSTNILTRHQARTLRNRFQERINAYCQVNRHDPIYQEEQRQRVIEARRLRAEAIAQRKASQDPSPSLPGGSSSAE
jgi:hypothetical protein